MTFYLIGLGLSMKGISLEALEILRKCKKIYMENYTVELPYEIYELEEKIGQRIIPMTRLMIESEKFIEEAKRQETALLVYGSPLIATTHISLILKCKKEKIRYRVIHNASILDAISETGLQNYKFGKTASMPKWEKNYEPDSFKKIILDNLKINAHTLILVDIGLSFSEALEQLKKVLKGMKLDKIVVCSQMGTENSKIYYDKLNNLNLEVHAPFCIIIPAKLHFLEEESLSEI